MPFFHSLRPRIAIPIAMLVCFLVFGSAAVAFADQAIVNNTTTSSTSSQSQQKLMPAKVGWNQDTDGSWYYFTSLTSTSKTGWLKTGGKWYYLDPVDNGKMKVGKYQVAGNWYISNSSGAMQASKWVKLGSDWYYATKSGALKTGWHKSKNKWYWLQPDQDGLMAVGQWISDKNKRYYLKSDNGDMATKWFKVDSGWYYANASGAQQMGGWVKSGSKWYWLQADQQGLMAQGKWVADKGKRYYLKPGNGDMATKWFQTEQGWYYANASGAMKTGWIKSSGIWYYLQPDQQGLMIANATKAIDSKLYAFDANGAMRANTTVELGDGKVGYAASSGAITQVGVKENGKLVLRNAQGTPLTGWQKIGGAWFYGDEDGVAHTGWLQLGSTWYWMDANGVMATGTRTIDGKSYSFSSSGAWVQITGNASLDSRMIAKAKSLGSLRACYDWTKNHTHTNWASGGGVLRYANGTHALTTSWVGTEAQRMLDGETTDCYAFSSCFACLARALGYDAKVVNGYVPSRSKGWASHSWVEIKQGGTTYVYDPDLGHSIPSVNFYAFTYGNAPTNYKR